MNTQIRHYSKLILLLLIGMTLTTGVQAEINTISSAINKAGRQRMLTQRIVATYCQIGLDIKTSTSNNQLKDAIALFDQQLNELKEYRPTGPIHEQLNKVSTLWAPMKQIASATVNRTQAEKLRLLAEDVLRNSHRVVIMLQDESGSQAGRLVNIAGRQRMLSQRMSNLYMLKSWGFKSSEYNFDYSTAINEFKGALSELAASPLNTSQINAALANANKQFKILQRTLSAKEKEAFPLIVKMSADKLLGQMNDITHMYEDISSSS